MGPIETYSTLELNTDINQPPDNWLHDSLQGRFSNWTSARHEPPNDLSSFNMAHSFLENIDDVDVISDAENIKKLLKMPFSKNGISLSVNKVGKTLLLDEFDVQNVLSQAAQKEKLEDMQWLQDVFSEEANMEKNQTSLRRKKNPRDSRERNMMSKFLCYSSPDVNIEPDQNQFSSDITNQSHNATNIQTIQPSSSCRDLVPFLPEPFPKPQEKSRFQRNVLWKFEDTKMLIGSNMPIFGGGKYPAVSLRLNDCSKPINVLTGLDYWLDNLMCNVPEVVMCFHMDGIVQKYEHYKTDELPLIEGSQFSPGVIKDVARNILSFLKSNCTLEGHTYWLFKGHGSDVVKLYDLTSLCDKTSDESANPFSIPVAMLLYRVAKNMMNQTTITDREQNMVQVLLTNCLDLLNNEPRPDDHLEIITSSHYLLAEVFSLADQRNEEQILGNTATEEGANSECRDDDAFPWPKTLAISDLSKSNNFEESFEEVAVDVPVNVHEKLQISLSHVVKALKSLRRSLEDRKFSANETKRQTVLPSRPYILALPDATFTAKTGDEFVPHVTESESTDEMTPLNFNFRQWQGTFESVLIRKAAGLYSDLASLAHSDRAHGLALRYLRLSLLLLSSYRNLEWVNSNQELDLLPTVLCGCGDVYMSMAKSGDLTQCLEASEKDYGTANECDLYFDANYRVGNEKVYQLQVDFTPDVEKLLLKSENLYKRALDVSNDSCQIERLVTVTRRLGNIRNELGMLYMNTAVDMSVGANDETPELYWKKSLDAFSAGIRAFEAVDDRQNVALLHSNSGRLMRLCAQTLFNHSDKQGTISAQEKAYYISAIEHYQKSLMKLGERKSFPEVWDQVTWDLCGTYYTMGTLVQDYFSLEDSETETCEKEVSDLMFKSLKLCEGLKFSNEEMNSDVKHRIGSIHYRLGSLYHNSYRMLSPTDSNSKKKRHLAELHYNKAADQIDVTSYPTEWLRLNLERVALLEHQLSSARSKGSGASKIYDSILELLLESKHAFEAYKGGTDTFLSRDNVVCERMGPSLEGKLHFSGETKSENSSKNEKIGEVLTSQKQPVGTADNSGDNSAQYGTNYSAKQDRNNELGNTVDDDDSNEFLNLLQIFEQRLKNCLKENLKLRTGGRATASTQEKERENVLKRIFEVTLRASVTRKPKTSSPAELCKNVLETIAVIEKLLNNTDIN
ncbi:erythroid differentiation-related factor 1-like [Dendronephthya gigantea]|uniref:erythroid differentiation-related factor 1-like n=1 Tax=Dendronephthya gigantea TaxID=151771 RepID=UPI00106C227F|nr:erythroid differentiation-related factor 1-like [Dendronephthya gigantea]